MLNPIFELTYGYEYQLEKQDDQNLGFGHPAFPIDTHIHRLAQRWGLTNGKNVVQTENDLKRLFPRKYWNKLHLQIIYYGREYCKARDCYGLSCKICTSCYPSRKKPFIAKKP